MDRKHRKKNIAILAAALLMTAVIGMAGVFAPDLAHSAQGVFGALATPFRAAASFLSDRVADAGDYLLGHRALQQQVAQLEDQVARLSRENREAQAALEENARLRELLGLQRRHTDFTFLAATVTGRSGSGWTGEITLSVGAGDGVEEGMCVVTEQGYLVGVIDRTGPDHAVVRTLPDPNTAIGAMVSPGGCLGVLEGGLEELSQGLCRLSYLDLDAGVEPGDAVVTSGLGGLYPAGLLLGTVTQVEMDPSGMECCALVTPAADSRRVSQVFVITAFDAAE